MFWELGAVVWVLLCLAVAYYATTLNRRYFLWGLLAFFVSPILTAIVLFCLGEYEEEDESTPSS